MAFMQAGADKKKKSAITLVVVMVVIVAIVAGFFILKHDDGSVPSSGPTVSGPPGSPSDPSTPSGSSKKIGTTWTQIADNSQDLNISYLAADGDYVYGTSSNKQVYSISVTPGTTSAIWAQVTPPHMNQIQVQGSSIYGLGDDNEIFSIPKTGAGDWTKLNDSSMRGSFWVDTGLNVYAIGHHWDNLYLLSHGKSDYDHIAYGSPTLTSVVVFDNDLFLLQNFTLAKIDGTSGGPIRILPKASNIKIISIFPVGKTLYGLQVNTNMLYKLTGSDGPWVLIPTTPPSGQVLAAITGNSTTLFAVSMGHLTYKLT